jgi:carbonic anhydrase
VVAIFLQIDANMENSALTPITTHLHQIRDVHNHFWVKIDDPPLDLSPLMPKPGAHFYSYDSSSTVGCNEYVNW